MEHKELYISTAVAAAALGVGLYLWSNNQKKNSTIPGPDGMPFIGALREMLPYASEGRLHEFFHELVVKYGPIVNLPLPGGSEMVIIADAEAARSILFNRAAGRVEKSAEFQKFTVLKQGMVALFGEQHKVHRKHLVNAFIPNQLNQTIGASAHYATRLMNIWKQQTISGNNAITVDIYKSMMAMTTDVLGKILFSHEFNSLDRIADPLPVHGAFEVAMDMMVTVPAKRAGKPEILWDWYGISQAQLKAALKPVYDLLNEVIIKKRFEIKKHGGRRPGAVRDLIDLLLEADETGREKFSPEEIIDEAATFYLGGHDTTASTLTWTFFELCQHPHVVSKLQDEIDNMIASRTDLDNIHLARFEYLDHVFSEVLRLHPPTVMANWRTAVTDLQVMGHRIAAGSRIMIAIREIQRSDAYWTDAQDFNPGRWANLKAGHEYLPFSDGEYKCIGHKMATMEVKATMVAILSKYTPRFVSGQNPRGIYSATLALKNGYMVEMVERHL
ncbi:hypothetical protein SmJEL517_g04668 [Synchytrium microbalum]|uniref:Cytochrome P450 n=1 Tax=Synchytrium microbalum TaxID=1806994 RepID=A0A507BXG4_9FUNG|nr:uncharacterized protein SmJEL517_g04668 [Synchytrium microbalum]TPX32122.1 hypothetical protein SmJEL517_g04668 [Synchytrium microbalum]